MTDKEAIKYLQQLYPNGGHCWLDEQRIEAIGMAIQALQEEPVSEDLEKASKEYATNLIGYDEENNQAITELNDIEYYAFKAGAQWQKEQMTKDAVEAEIEITSKGILLPNLKIEDFDYADKARLIIIKEDEL